MQGEKNFFTLGAWVYTVSICALNLFVFSWLATIPAWHLQRTGLVRGGTPVASLDDEWTLGRAIVDFVLHILVIEVRRRAEGERPRLRRASGCGCGRSVPPALRDAASRAAAEYRA